MGLKTYLETKQNIKLVCGAGNENTEEVERLVAVYAAAGCRFFDLSAREEIVIAAKKALKKVLPEEELKNCYLCVSVGLKGDPHVSKAIIDNNLCINCGACAKACQQNAIVKQNIYKVVELNCIGCKCCFEVCKSNAISFISKDVELRKVLPPLISQGIHCIELHALRENEEELKDKWQIINEKFDGMLSICLDRSKLGNEYIIKRIKNMIKDRKPYSTIIQADGNPMSGSKDDFKTTLQTVAMAEIVQNANLPVFILLSGGTNSKTAELAKMCAINANCVAIGSFARKIVRQYIDDKDFWANQQIFNAAVDEAKKLISASILD